MPKPLLLWEVKTIDGDAPVQVRAAVAQLLFYEYFKIRPHWPDREVLRAVAFDQHISDELTGFLTWAGVAAFRVADDSSLQALNDIAREVAGVLAELPV